ncbi:MAG: hypothetical protein Q7S73_02745, partial [bacterium]|nr:hypothetical protein [bacterium]
MPKKQIIFCYRNFIRLASFSLIFLFSFSNVFAVSGIPTILSYQGRLTNSSGDLVTGTYYFKFSIWDNPTINTGNQLWPSTAHSVSATVRSGVFNVNIGDTANGFPDPLNYNFNTNNTVYLQVEVSSTDSGFEKLSPRQQITSAAFAQIAGAVSGTSTPSSFGTTTPIGNSVVTIEASSSNAIPLSIRGALNQINNLLQIQDSTSANLLYLNSSGALFASSTLQVTGTSVFYSNLGIGTSTPGSLLAVQGNALISGNLNVANITATGTLTVSGSATSTFAGGVSATNLNLTGSMATSTFSNGIQFKGGSLQLLQTGCNGASVLETDANGNIQCGADAGGSGADTNAVNTWSALQTFSAGILSTASSTFSNNLNISGPLSASSTLNVGGLANLSGFISSASSTVAGSLQVSGVLQASSTLTANKILSAGSGTST